MSHIADTLRETVARKYLVLANEATGQSIRFARDGSPEFARLRRNDARSLRRLASEELRKSLPTKDYP